MKLKSLLVCILIVVSINIPQHTQAVDSNILYVGETEEFHTIQEALDVANDGDRIVVRDGIYPPIFVNKSVHIQNYNRIENVTIGSEISKNTVTINADNVYLIGINIINGSASMFSRGVSIRGNHALIRDCHIFNNSNGLYVRENISCIIKDSTITSNLYGGLQCAGSENIVIYNTTVKDNTFDDAFVDIGFIDCKSISIHKSIVGKFSVDGLKNYSDIQDNTFNSSIIFRVNYISIYNNTFEKTTIFSDCNMNFCNNKLHGENIFQQQEYGFFDIESNIFTNFSLFNNCQNLNVHNNTFTVKNDIRFIFHSFKECRSSVWYNNERVALLENIIFGSVYIQGLPIPWFVMQQ